MAETENLKQKCTHFPYVCHLIDETECEIICTVFADIAAIAVAIHSHSTKGTDLNYLCQSINALHYKRILCIESLTSVYIFSYRGRISNSCHFFPVVCQFSLLPTQYHSVHYNNSQIPFSSTAHANTLSQSVLSNNNNNERARERNKSIE